MVGQSTIDGGAVTLKEGECVLLPNGVKEWTLGALATATGENGTADSTTSTSSTLHHNKVSPKLGSSTNGGAGEGNNSHTVSSMTLNPVATSSNNNTDDVLGKESNSNVESDVASPTTGR